MSAPQTINEYLAAFNEALEVGLRSRRRIFWEVTEHLRQAAGEQVRRGANAQEAQQRAIALFGSPEEVAARFETGVFGRLDRRLALSARWLYRFTTERSAGAIFAVIALGLVLAAAVAVIGAIFGRDSLAAAAVFFGVGAGIAQIYGRRTRAHEFRRMFSRGTDATWVAIIAYPAVVSCLVLLGGADAVTSWQTFLAGTLTYVGWGVIQCLIDGFVKHASRHCAGATDAERRHEWRAERPSRAALADVAPLPLALLALIAAYPAPGDLRFALAGLLAAVGGLAVAIVRLEHGRREKDDYRTFYDRLANNSPTRGARIRYER